MIKTYSELILLDTFEKRFDYLKLDGVVGKDTFGFDRYLNQILYSLPEWKRCRREIIVRDNGFNLGCDRYEILGKVFIHHIDPITVEDILSRHPKIFDYENLITTSLDTHNAIHYGNADLIIRTPTPRSKNDTCPWKQ